MQGTIPTEECEGFTDRLGQWQTIERIPVVEGQLFEREDVFRGDRKQRKAEGFRPGDGQESRLSVQAVGVSNLLEQVDDAELRQRGVTAVGLQDGLIGGEKETSRCRW